MTSTDPRGMCDRIASAEGAWVYFITCQIAAICGYARAPQQG